MGFLKHISETERGKKISEKLGHFVLQSRKQACPASVSAPLTSSHVKAQCYGLGETASVEPTENSK